MQTAQITVKYINPPKGKGPASVKDANGTYWKFWTRDVPLEQFQQNASYTVGYKTEKYNGEDQYYIEEVLPDSPPAPRQNGHPAPAGNGNGKYATTDTATAERIFVCGAINHAIGAGKVDVFQIEDIVSAVECLRAAYAATFGK